VPTANAEGRVRSTTSGEFTPDAETELPAREASRAEQTTAPIDGSAAMTVPHSRRDAPAGTRSLALEQDESGSAASGTQVPKQQDPDTWLERIEALRDEGRTAEADAELERFRQAYPDRALLDAGASRE
jgi:hypothetical protein